jgi:hypothetical protein
MDEQRLERALREGPRFRTQYAAGQLALDRPLARPAPNVGRVVFVLAVTSILLALTFGALAAAGFFDDEPSSYAIVVEQMSLPPDGPFEIRHIVFRPGESSPDELEGFPSNATQLTWSGNGRRVAYFTLDRNVPDGEQPGSRNGFYVADGDGENPVPVAIPRAAADYLLDSWWSSPSWSPSNDLIALIALSGCAGEPECGGFIDVFNMEGRLVATFPVDEDPGQVRFPMWSPDSKWVAWNTHGCLDSNCSATTFHARSLDDPNRELSLAIGAPGEIRWAEDGRLLVVANDQYGRARRVYTVETDGSDELDVDWNKDHDQGTDWVRWSDDGQYLLMGPRAEHPWFVRDLERDVDALLAYPGSYSFSFSSPDNEWLVVYGGAQFPVEDEFGGYNRLVALRSDGSGQPQDLGSGQDATWMPLD